MSRHICSLTHPMASSLLRFPASSGFSVTSCFSFRRLSIRGEDHSFIHSFISPSYVHISIHSPIIYLLTHSLTVHSLTQQLSQLSTHTSNHPSSITLSAHTSTIHSSTYHPCIHPTILHSSIHLVIYLPPLYPHSSVALISIHESIIHLSIHHPSMLGHSSSDLLCARVCEAGWGSPALEKRSGLGNCYMSSCMKRR